jgi:hypothetical protein
VEKLSRIFPAAHEDRFFPGVEIALHVTRHVVHFAVYREPTAIFIRVLGHLREAVALSLPAAPLLPDPIAC